MEQSQPRRFGPFRLDLRNERLWRGSDGIVLRPKTFAVLAHLVRHAGELVSRDALLRAVWPDVAVSEAVLTMCISEIRQALGDSAHAAHYVETLHRRGYRFIAPMTSSRGPDVRAPASRRMVGRARDLAELERGWRRRAGALGVSCS